MTLTLTDVLTLWGLLATVFCLLLLRRLWQSYADEQATAERIEDLEERAFLAEYAYLHATGQQYPLDDTEGVYHDGNGNGSSAGTAGTPGSTPGYAGNGLHAGSTGGL